MKNIFKFSAAVLFGFAIGATVVWFHYRNAGIQFGNFIVDLTYARIVDDIATLTLLRREAHLELIEQKEQSASQEILALSLFDPLSISEKQRRYLIMAVRYWEQYPLSTGDPDSDQELNAFLRKIQEGNHAEQRQ